MQYQDGTRAVVHRITGGVYALEGQPFSYGGGYDEPSSSEGPWISVCPGSAVVGDAYVNDWS